MKQELKNTQTIQINTCRIHLQVSFISDMVRPNGKYIINKFLRGEIPNQLISNHRWS